MQQRQFVCTKCGCTTYTSDQFQATGGDFAKFFNVQNKNLLPSHVHNVALLSCTVPRPLLA